MINLKEWYISHPAKEFTYKGTVYPILGKRYDAKKDDTLNKYQRMHLNGELNVYEPIVAYSRQYDHITSTSKGRFGMFVEAIPKSEPKRNDLPPLYLQWKEEYRKRK